MKWVKGSLGAAACALAAVLLVTAGCATLEPQPEPEPLEISVETYWKARASADWRTAYEYEAYKDIEEFAAYSVRQTRALSGIPFRFLGFAGEPEVDEEKGMAVAPVKVAYQFRYPARAEMEYTLRDVWVRSEGRWLHAPRQEDRPGMQEE